MLTLTPPPIAMSAAELRHRITHLDRAADRAERNRQYQDAAAYTAALDECALELIARERAEQGARGYEAVARSLDAYDADRAGVLASVYERR